MKYIFILLFFVPMVLFGVLASPLGRDQPTEVWLLSKIRFFLKSRKRLWDQEGLEELVSVTAPKKTEVQLTKNLSQVEVKSRLKTLASTLDTRGWAIKNVDTNLNTVIPNNPALSSASDRLVANAGYTQPAPVIDIHPADDILDEQNNPTAQKFASLMAKEDESRRRGVLETMKGLIDESDDPVRKLKSTTATVLEKELAKARASFGKDKKHAAKHHKILTAKSVQREAAKPVQKKTAQPVADQAKSTPVTSPRQAVNMELAQSGSAFSVTTLSELANRRPRAEQTGPDEITISLH